MQMENQVKFLIPQNISGASQQKKFNLKSQGTEKKTGYKQLVQVFYKKSPEAPRTCIDTEDVLNLHYSC